MGAAHGRLMALPTSTLLLHTTSPCTPAPLHTSPQPDAVQAFERLMEEFNMSREGILQQTDMITNLVRYHCVRMVYRTREELAAAGSLSTELLGINVPVVPGWVESL